LTRGESTHKTAPLGEIDLGAERKVDELERERELLNSIANNAPSLLCLIVSESLNNVAKYAGASRAAVRVRETGERLVVVVEDDGQGGANMDGGTGLRGLVDRVSALDGKLDVDSPSGGGTRLRAELPLA
jgi:signal transduction histidine kinase